MLCDAQTAYLSRFDVYLGKQGNNNPEHGLAYNIVTKLTDNLHGYNHHIYFDNFFTSINLLEDLYANGLYACGTVRLNRKGFPKYLKKSEAIKKRGDCKILQKEGTNLTASVWRDKKNVYHLSTLSDPKLQMQAQRRVGNNILDVPQPHAVYNYNKYMGGVDLHDQLRMKYDVGRNSKRWWKYLFWFLLNSAIVNAFILYKCASKRQIRKRYTHLNFRLELVRDLIGGYSKRKRSWSEIDRPGLVEVENIMGHINVLLPGRKKRCRYHLKQLQVRRETVYGCSVCAVHLCRDGCHAKFHNM
jgi:hypothetical protein